jgi:hypothetical protein
MAFPNERSSFASDLDIGNLISRFVADADSLIHMSKTT